MSSIVWVEIERRKFFGVYRSYNNNNEKKKKKQWWYNDAEMKRKRNRRLNELKQKNTQANNIFRNAKERTKTTQKIAAPKPSIKPNGVDSYCDRSIYHKTKQADVLEEEEEIYPSNRHKIEEEMTRWSKNIKATLSMIQRLQLYIVCLIALKEKSKKGKKNTEKTAGKTVVWYSAAGYRVPHTHTHPPLSTQLVYHTMDRWGDMHSMKRIK